jgi:uncharacterized membrane protein
LIEEFSMATITTTLTPPLAHTSTWSRFGWAVLLLGAIMASAHALLFATVPDYPIADPIARHRMFVIAAIGYAHTLGGAIASLIGPFQFLGWVRRRHPRWHVWLGRIYLVCVAAGALAGLYLSPGSYAANTFGIAFILLALAWLYTGAQAYLTIRRRDVQAHRRWMIRNYALTYAAVTLRLQMPALIVWGGLSPILALNIVGWTCWVPSLIVVELWMRRRGAGGQPTAPQVGARWA